MDAGSARARPPDAAPLATAESFGDGPGQSPATAIQVCRPVGQVAYLRRLRCGGDRAPVFAREGQRGYRNPRHGDADYERSTDQVRTWRPLAEGETDLHPIDVYSVRCGGGAERELYLDMYHCGEGEQTTDAPPGFTLAPAPATTPAPEK